MEQTNKEALNDYKLIMIWNWILFALVLLILLCLIGGLGYYIIGWYVLILFFGLVTRKMYINKLENE